MRTEKNETNMKSEFQMTDLFKPNHINTCITCKLCKHMN